MQRLLRPNSIPTSVRIRGFIAASAVVYTALAWRFPLPRLYDTIPPVDYAKLTRYSITGVLFLLTAYILLFGGLASLITHPPEGASHHVRYVAAGLALPLLFLYPIFAIDFFLYALHTRVWLFHHQNPFLIPPGRCPGDRWIGLSGEWINATSGYGPVWEVLAAIPGLLAGAHHFLAHLMGLKVIAYLAYLTDVWMLDRILHVWRPEERVRRLMYFAWNPLVLLEFVGNGHNDSVMLGFILLALWLLLQQREFWAHVAMAMAVLVKIPALFLWGLLWVWSMARHRDWTTRVRITGEVLGLAVLTGGIFAWILWPNPHAWQAVRENTFSSRSPQTLAILIAMGLHIPHAFARVQQTAQALFIIAALGVVGWLWHRTSREEDEPTQFTHLVHAWLALIVLLLYLFASNWRPWYATWLLPLAALSPSSAWLWGVFALAFTAETGDVYWTNVRWRFLGSASPLVAHVIGVLYVFGIPAMVLALYARRESAFAPDKRT